MSVGIIPRHLPFTSSNASVSYFRHAISLDERRAKFKLNYWKPFGTEAQYSRTAEGNYVSDDAGPVADEVTAIEQQNTSERGKS